MIDLFDGKLHGERPAQVHFVESVEGQAVDYDFTLDVGLIRIRPDAASPPRESCRRTGSPGRAC